MSEGYDSIPEPEDAYDNPQFHDMSDLCLRIAYNDDTLPESNQSRDNHKFIELQSLPGWCPKINDRNVRSQFAR